MIFFDRDKQKSLQSSWVFLDTGILIDSCNHEICYQTLLELFPDQSFVIDPFVRLEFLRNTFEPKFVQKKESMIAEEPFVSATSHTQVFEQVLNNALALSRTITQKFKRGHYDPSAIDLIVMGRAMLYRSSYIVTSDFGDFPSQIFPKKNIISMEVGNGDKLTQWQILQFDTEALERLSQQTLRKKGTS